MEADVVDLDEEGNIGTISGQNGSFEPSPSLAHGTEVSQLQIPPRGRGTRMSFLLGIPASSSTFGGAQVQGGRGSVHTVPPVHVTGGSRKRGCSCTPVALSSDVGGQVEKKGKHTAIDQPGEKAKPPTSCGTSESMNDISDDEEDEVAEVNSARTRRLTSDVGSR